MSIVSKLINDVDNFLAEMRGKEITEVDDFKNSVLTIVEHLRNGIEHVQNEIVEMNNKLHLRFHEFEEEIIADNTKSDTENTETSGITKISVDSTAQTDQTMKIPVANEATSNQAQAQEQQQQ